MRRAPGDPAGPGLEYCGPGYEIKDSGQAAGIPVPGCGIGQGIRKWTQPLESTPVKHEGKIFSQGWSNSAKRQVEHHEARYPEPELAVLEVLSTSIQITSSPL